jgi:hypothetical protein
MKIIAIILLLTLSIAHAQLVIKGHTLGEGFTDTLTRSGEPSAVDECRTFLSTHQKKESFALDKKGRLPKFDSFRAQENVNAHIERCESVLNASTGARTHFFVKELGDGYFHDGKLVGVEIEFLNIADRDHQVSYDKVRDDGAQKYGKPSEEGTTTWQNGFGATWHPRYAMWITDTVVVHIEEGPPEYHHDLPNVWVKAFLKTELESMPKHENRPNVFDQKK